MCLLWALSSGRHLLLSDTHTDQRHIQHDCYLLTVLVLVFNDPLVLKRGKQVETEGCMEYVLFLEL